MIHPWKWKLLRGTRGFPAAPRDRPRESFFNASMAEMALGALTNLEGHARSLEENLQKMVQLIARLSETTGAGLLVNQISRNSNRTGWDSKTREDLLNELAARGCPSIRVFSNESVLNIRWPKYWSFSISPFDE